MSLLPVLEDATTTHEPFKLAAGPFPSVRRARLRPPARGRGKLHNLGHQGPADAAVRYFCAARGTYDGPATLAGIQGDVESRHGSLQPVPMDTTEDA